MAFILAMSAAFYNFSANNGFQGYNTFHSLFETRFDLNLNSRLTMAHKLNKGQNRTLPRFCPLSI